MKNSETEIKHIIATENCIIDTIFQIASAVENASYEAKVRNVEIPDFAVNLKAIAFTMIDLFPEQFRNDSRKDLIKKMLSAV